MIFSLSHVSFAVLTLICCISTHAQSMTDIGTLGGTYSEGMGVSGNGSVIVGDGLITGSGSIYHAFTYTSSTMVDLGTLGGSSSFATGTSNDGSVVVGYSQITGSNTYRAFKYIGSTMTDLGTLGGASSYAFGVSSDGSVIVGESWNGSTTHAFKYSGSTMSDLGTLGGTTSSAAAVSGDGSVIVGNSRTAGGAVHAFKYTGSTMSDLGTLGGTTSYAYGVSGDGSAIVGKSLITGSGSTYHAFKYTGSAMSDLGTLGGTSSSAVGASSNGSVIVGQSQITGNGAYHVFAYTGSTMTDLGTLGGANSYVAGVSNDGSVIVGTSDTASGDSHAFVYRTGGGGSLVDVQNTYAELSAQGYQLNSLFNAQNTALAINLNSDCTVYGANNICISVGGRYANVSNPSASQTAGNFQLGYRFHPAVRVGVFLDQGIGNATSNNYTLKNSQPLAGVFAVYAPGGSNLGLQVKVSGAYGSNDVNISRNTLANTEAGQGSSTMTTQGAQLETAYGFIAGDSWIVSPILGIKTTQVNRNGYTETAGATFLATYNTVNQSATTIYAGAKVFGYAAPKISIGASAGVEQDISSSIDNYSGSTDFLGAFTQSATAIQKTRAFIAANIDYWIENNQRVGLGVYYNQQSLNSSDGVTAMLSYTVGL